jgi:hypothetical protein
MCVSHNSGLELKNRIAHGRGKQRERRKAKKGKLIDTNVHPWTFWREYATIRAKKSKDKRSGGSRACGPTSAKEYFSR